MKSDVERITALEVRTDMQETVIQEMRAELKEIRDFIQAINSKLASITHDQAQMSARLESTHALTTDIKGRVDGYAREEDNHRYAAKLGIRFFSWLAALGTFLITAYSYRYAILDFIKRVFV